MHWFAESANPKKRAQFIARASQKALLSSTVCETPKSGLIYNSDIPEGKSLSQNSSPDGDVFLPECKKRKICHTGLTAEIDILSLAGIHSSSQLDRSDNVRVSTPREHCMKDNTKEEKCSCSNFEMCCSETGLKSSKCHLHQDSLSPIDKADKSSAKAKLYNDECSISNPVTNLHSHIKHRSNSDFQSPKSTTNLRACQHTSGYATGSESSDESGAEKENVKPENESCVSSMNVMDNCESSFHSSLGDPFVELDENERHSVFLRDNRRSRCETISQNLFPENFSPTTPIKSGNSYTHQPHMETPISGSVRGAGTATKNIKFQEQVYKFEPSVMDMSEEEEARPDGDVSRVSAEQSVAVLKVETPMNVSYCNVVNNKKSLGTMEVSKVDILFLCQNFYQPYVPRTLGLGCS